MPDVRTCASIAMWSTQPGENVGGSRALRSGRRNRFGKEGQQVSAQPRLTEEQASESTAEGYSRLNPFPAVLLTNRMLTAEGSGKEVRHFEISLEGSGLNYEVGDALGVKPTNCSSLVEELFDILHCDGEEAVQGPRGKEIFRFARR